MDDNGKVNRIVRPVRPARRVIRPTKPSQHVVRPVRPAVKSVAQQPTSEQPVQQAASERPAEPAVGMEVPEPANVAEPGVVATEQSVGEKPVSEQPAGQTVERLAEQSAEQSVPEQLVEQPSEQPVERSFEQPSEKLSEQPKSVQDQMAELISEHDEKVQEQILEKQKVEAAAKAKKKRTTIITVILVIIVLLAAGAVLLFMNWDAWFGTKNTPTPIEPEVVVENTELQGGTVTVIIDGEAVTYAGAYIVDGINATISSGEYASALDNQAVFVVVNGGILTIDGDVKIGKSGNKDAVCDAECDKYGLNSAIVLVGSSSQATIRGAEIETSVAGANGIIAIDGALVTMENVLINTMGEKSRGLYAMFGGLIEGGSNVGILTNGDLSPALSADGDLSYVKVAEMQLNTAGIDSPLIYSNGSSVIMADSVGVSERSQVMVTENDGLVDLMDCDFSGVDE